jgi:ATP/ADP translocase
LLLNVIFVGSSLVQLAPMITVIFAVILLVWFYAVYGLSKEFTKLSAEHNS